MFKFNSNRISILVLFKKTGQMVELNRDLIITNYHDKSNEENIVNRNINRINSNAFKEFTEFKFLLLGHDEIERLDATLFESLSNLEVLNLYDNRLKEIRSNTFKGLTQLKTLKLSKKQTDNNRIGRFQRIRQFKDIRLEL